MHLPAALRQVAKITKSRVIAGGACLTKSGGRQYPTAPRSRKRGERGDEKTEEGYKERGGSSGRHSSGAIYAFSVWQSHSIAGKSTQYWPAQLIASVAWHSILL